MKKYIAAPVALLRRLGQLLMGKLESTTSLLFSTGATAMSPISIPQFVNKPEQPVVETQEKLDLPMDGDKVLVNIDIDIDPPDTVRTAMVTPDSLRDMFENLELGVYLDRTSSGVDNANIYVCPHCLAFVASHATGDVGHVSIVSHHPDCKLNRLYKDLKLMTHL